MKECRSDTTLAIICGGLATRLGGVAKGMIEIGGRTIIRRQLDELSGLVEDIILIANQGLPYRELSLRTLPDEVEGIGPIGGLLTALRHCRTDRLLLIACDMPLVEVAVAGLLLDARRDADMVVPVIEGKPEPLFCRVASSCLKEVERYVNLGRYKITDLYSNLDIEFIEERRLRSVDPELKSFVNINHPEDVSRLRKVVDAEST